MLSTTPIRILKESIKQFEDKRYTKEIILEYLKYFVEDLSYRFKWDSFINGNFTIQEKKELIKLAKKDLKEAKDKYRYTLISNGIVPKVCKENDNER